MFNLIIATLGLFYFLFIFFCLFFCFFTTKKTYMPLHCIALSYYWCSWIAPFWSCSSPTTSLHRPTEIRVHLFKFITSIIKIYVIFLSILDARIPALGPSDEWISLNGHKKISEYIRMPHYVPNDYPNIFECHIFTKLISKYICKSEIAWIRIEIILEGNFIRIFEHSYSSLVEDFF